MEEDYVEEEMNSEDVAYEAHHKVDALIDLLVKKGVISNDEYDTQIDELIEEMEGDEEEGDEDDSSDDDKNHDEGCSCV